MTEDSNAWVFDSLICFLHGPIWNAPLQTFIEEKSLIFDPNDKSDEFNDEYKKIHEEYKHLVDFMLGSFMEEMQITPEQFEVACLVGKQGQNNAHVSFHQGLFQQIWAANDIRIFVRMMTQRNVELQLQVLDVIERRHMNSVSNDEPNTDNAVAGSSTGKNRETAALDDITQEEMEKIVAEEALEENKSASQIESEMVKNAEQNVSDEAEVSDKIERLNLFFEKEHIDSSDIKTRQEYLRAQRDKILAIKKKVRTNQLNENAKNSGRPTSARAAQNVLLGDGKIGEEPIEASLQLRKTLAKRLRSEVVNPEK